jgi:hypothetical protein
VCRVRAAGKGFGGVGGYDGLSSCQGRFPSLAGRGPVRPRSKVKGQGRASATSVQHHGVTARGSRPRCYLKPRADLAARRALHRGRSRDATVRSCWTGVPREAWVMDPMQARGGGGSPRMVVERSARRRTAGWLHADTDSRRGAQVPAGGARPHPNGPFLGENGVHRLCPPGPARRITDGGGSPTVKVARELRVPTCARAGVGDGVPDLDGHSGVRREGVALATFYCRAGLESPTACAVLGEG